MFKKPQDMTAVLLPITIVPEVMPAHELLQLFIAISQLSALESTKGLRLRSLGGTWGEPLPRSEAGKTDPLTKPIGGRLSNSDAPMVRLVLLALET
jgi:hypothetical protein